MFLKDASSARAGRSRLMTTSLLNPIGPRETARKTSAIPPRPSDAKSWYLPNANAVALAPLPGRLSSRGSLSSDWLLPAPSILHMDYLPGCARSRQRDQHYDLATPQVGSFFEASRVRGPGIPRRKG